MFGEASIGFRAHQALVVSWSVGRQGGWLAVAGTSAAHGASAAARRGGASLPTLEASLRAHSVAVGLTRHAAASATGYDGIGDNATLQEGGREGLRHSVIGTADELRRA